MKKMMASSIIAILFFTACEKKVDPVDGNNANIVLINSGTNYVTGDVTVNPKDSIFFNFTIDATKDMKYISIQKNPINQTAFLVRDTLTTTSKNLYSSTKKFAADSVNGSFLYRIVAHDAQGTYIGHKDIVVIVRADFSNFTYRFLYVPDTTTKTNTTYMAATTGNVYSYTTGAANSALIDFGLMYDTTGAATPITTDDLKFSLYALNAPQSQLSFYDISTWTKNATIMKKAAAPAFNTLTSGAALRAAAIANLSAGTANKIPALVSGNLVFFKTVTGKSGCMQINFVNGSSPAKESYMNVDVKIEK